MEILNFGGNTPSGKKRSSRAMLAVAALLVGVVGSTFAANISINNSPVEYGQGVGQTTACDANITITPGNTFINSAGGSGTFYIKTINITDTNTVSSSTGLGNCVGKGIKVTAYDGTANSSALFTCDVTGLAFSASGTANSVAYTNGITSSSNCSSTASVYAVNNGFQISYTTPATAPNVSAANIYKFTLESHV